MLQAAVVEMISALCLWGVLRVMFAINMDYVSIRLCYTDLCSRNLTLSIPN
jgi:hypothetical protein